MVSAGIEMPAPAECSRISDVPRTKVVRVGTDNS